MVARLIYAPKSSCAAFAEPYTCLRPAGLHVVVEFFFFVMCSDPPSDAAVLQGVYSYQVRDVHGLPK
jgi:hypothetical protein